MKQILPLAAVVLVAGCSTFRTVQIDYRYDEEGRIENRIKTTAKARTFWESESSLASWTAEQTNDKQSATVGDLGQRSDSGWLTNAAPIVEAAAEGTIKGLKAANGLP